MSERPTATEPPYGGMFEVWRSFYETSQQIWSGSLKYFTGMPVFAGAQGKMLESFLGIPQAMRQAMSVPLTMLNMPTNDDVSRVAESVSGLEQDLSDLGAATGGLNKNIGQLGASLTDLKSDIMQLGTLTGTIAKHLDKLDQRLAMAEERLGDLAGIEKKIGTLDKRFATVEQRLAELPGDIEKPAAKVEKRLAALEKPMDAVEKDVDKLSKQSAGLKETLGSVDKKIGQVEKRLGAVEQQIGRLPRAAQPRVTTKAAAEPAGGATESPSEQAAGKAG